MQSKLRYVYYKPLDKSNILTFAWCAHFYYQEYVKFCVSISFINPFAGGDVFLDMHNTKLLIDNAAKAVRGDLEIDDFLMKEVEDTRETTGPQ